MASGKKSSDKKGADKIKQISESTSAPSSAEELNNKFEVELCWCIQQLELLLAENKLNPARTKDSIKALNVLKNNSQPIIKKRQVMNLTFGDYRAKMAEEEKKLAKVNQQIKFTDKPNKNSVFVKKSAHLTGASNFKFNFPENSQSTDQSENKDPIDLNLINSEKDKADVSVNNFKFESTGNSFRFNFSDENDVSVS